ncbi:hypothetical protein A3Q56_08500 [Intoshia linei]|uniref:F-box domain-containing protein n=1 Tax=Intoshia linei TaxID=1819745 RepID=A0A177ARB3_9BILA|nr:hypothetical protein A3Q56_08500 [Intoshia linei]
MFYDIKKNVYIDKIITRISHNCPKLQTISVMWESSNIKYAMKNKNDIDNHFKNIIKKCPNLTNFCLQPGKYHNMAIEHFIEYGNTSIIKLNVFYPISLFCCSEYYSYVNF